MRNTIILAVVLFVAVVTASIFYFRNLDSEQSLAARPLRLLPDNTLLIVATHNNEITDNIFKDFEVFDAILGFDYADRLAFLKKHLLRHEHLADFVQDTELYFSFHREADQAEMLITIPTTEGLAETHVSQVVGGLAEQYTVSTRDTLREKIYQIAYGEQDSSIFAVYHENTVFASESLNLITRILDKSTRRLTDDQVDFFLKNSSRNTPLSVYFAHQQLDSVVNLYQRRDGGVFLDLFQKLYGQSTWNINFKQDALILTGESEMDQYAENYISLFKNQEKTSQYLYHYFPANTAVYIEYSVTDPQIFKRDLADLFKRRKEQPISQADTTGLYKGLSDALGEDFAFVETSNQNYIGFVHQRDSLAWKALRDEFLEETNDSIARFKSSNVLYAHFGDAFKAFTRPYVTVVDSIVVIANSHQTLRTYRDDWHSRDLLIGTLGFKNFEKLQGNEANVTLFVHTSNANSKIINSLPTHFARNFRDKENFGFQDFYSWSAQLSGNNGKFSSQIYAVYKSKNALGVTPEWVYDFTDRAITQPYVFEHSDTAKLILIQELDHTIHAIHPSGRNLWSVVFSGRVVGDIQQLPDRSMVLVTDRSRLYRFDPRGKPLPGFSVALSDEPIHTPTITKRNGQDVIYVPMKRTVQVYDFSGDTIADWRQADFGSDIIGPVRAVDDQLVVGTTDGTIHFLDANGNKIKEVRLAQNRLSRNPMGMYLSPNDNHTVLWTDTAGVFYKLPIGQNSPAPYQLEELSASHMVDFRSVRGASSTDMIVMDENQLQLFDVQDSVRTVFTYNFTKGIDDRLQYFASPTERGQQLIGVSSRSTQLIYVFEPNGALLEGFPVLGQPQFYYGDINYNSGTYLLVMRRDHKLYAFKHQK